MEVARNFEVDSLAIFDSNCVNIDRIMNYKTREDVNFKNSSELSDLIEKDKLEDEQMRMEFEEQRKSAYDILKNVKLPSPVSTEDYTNDSTNEEYDYSTFYEGLWNLDIDETIENETIGDINTGINEIKDGILNKKTNDKEEHRR